MILCSFLYTKILMCLKPCITLFITTEIQAHLYCLYYTRGSLISWVHRTFPQNTLKVGRRHNHPYFLPGKTKLTYPHRELVAETQLLKSISNAVTTSSTEIKWFTCGPRNKAMTGTGPGLNSHFFPNTGNCCLSSSQILCTSKHHQPSLMLARAWSFSIPPEEGGPAAFPI